MGKLLRNVSDHCVFLSATPIHLKNNDLLSQLSLLDPGTFNLSNRAQARKTFEALIDANRPIIEAREIIASGQNNISEAKSYIEEALKNNLLQKDGWKRSQTVAKKMNKMLQSVNKAKL